MSFKSLQSPWESESSFSPFCQYTFTCRETLNEWHEERPSDLAGRQKIRFYKSDMLTENELH